LGISKYKNTALIDQLGQKLAEKYQIRYYPLIVDKNLVARQELELSKKYNFYRQNYCGCVYSEKTKK
jgi:predicted adenine nucleotide alpha hydrolase (AANH) superfamily ATPase